MKRLGIFAALLTLLTALSASVALAQTFSGSVDPANAPGSSHLASGTIACTVNVDQSIDCNAYVLGGVGHTDAVVALAARYSATIDCTNKGGNLVESHTADFTASSMATATSLKNGQLSVPAQEVSAFSAPQICPNPNWTPSIRAGTLDLLGFTYTLTFAGFTSPAVTITGQ
jgi:hypothetical protein